MPLQVCMGAQMMCSFGMAPSSLVVLQTNEVFERTWSRTPTSWIISR